MSLVFVLESVLMLCFGVGNGIRIGIYKSTCVCIGIGIGSRFVLDIFC